MAQFRRSIQPVGFRPEEVSTQNISQLQEYSRRISDALKEERDAVISNRNRVADAMKENATIEANQLSRDADIQNKNIETKIREQTLLSEKARLDYEVKASASKEIFSNIAGLSLTAALELQKVEAEKFKKQWDLDFAEMVMLGENSPKFKAVEAMIKEAESEEVKARSQIAEAQAKGLDPNEADRLSQRINELSPGARAGYLNNILQKYPTFLNEQFMDGTRQYQDENGKTFTGQEAARDQKRAGIVSAAALKQFMDINKVTGINPAFLQKAGFIPGVMSINQSIMSTAGKAEREDYATKFESGLEAELGAAKEDPTQTRTVLEKGWPELVRLKGYAGALDWIEGRAPTLDSDGKQLVNTAGIFDAKLGPKGETFGEYWSRRKEAIEIKIAQGRNAIHNQEQQTKQREAEQKWEGMRLKVLEQLRNGDAQSDNDVFATLNYQFSLIGFTPKGVAELQSQIEKQNMNESRAQYNIVLDKIRTGTATRGDIISITDPELRGKALQQFSATTQAASFGEDYETTLKSIDSAAKQIMRDSLEGSGSVEAQQLSMVMKRDFSRNYKEGLRKFGGDGERALQYATDILQRDKDAAVLNKDPKARYYSTLGPANQRIFTNVKALQSATNKQKAQAEENVNKTIGAKGVSALNTPGLVGTREQLRLISDSNALGQTLTFTPQILQAARLLKVSPLEVTNKAIAAFNKSSQSKIPLLAPDPSLRAVNNARPETQKLFFNNPTPGTVTRGAAEIGGRQVLSDPKLLRSSFRVNTPVTGEGFTIKGLNDRLGRPVVLDQPALGAFAQMIRDSKGLVKPSDVESSQRSYAHNKKVKGATRSPHLRGNALDIHGDSRTWMIKHGPKYGWVLVDYTGSHGGHFEYRP